MNHFTKHLGALAAGVATAVLMAGAALADPAIIYDLGGKFDKSFNEAAYNGAEAWKKDTGGNFADLELQNDAQREQALRRFASQGCQPDRDDRLLLAAPRSRPSPPSSRTPISS